MEPPIGTELLKKLVTYSKRRCDPRMNKQASDLLVSNYIGFRQKAAEERKNGAQAQLPITVRQLEAVARISESFARMELADTVQVGMNVRE